MIKKYDIKYLSTSFFLHYTEEQFPEILHKTDRPYMVLLITIEDNHFAIPFRTNIRHNSCYKFKSTSRPTDSITGLDYTKAVIINDSSYIGNMATIDDKEFVELSNKYFFIIKQFSSYVSGYVDYINGKSDIHKSARYQYTTLRYFHKELNLST